MQVVVEFILPDRMGPTPLEPKVCFPDLNQKASNNKMSCWKLGSMRSKMVVIIVISSPKNPKTPSNMVILRAQKKHRNCVSYRFIQHPKPLVWGPTPGIPRVVNYHWSPEITFAYSQGGHPSGEIQPSTGTWLRWYADAPGHRRSQGAGLDYPGRQRVEKSQGVEVVSRQGSCLKYTQKTLDSSLGKMSRQYPRHMPFLHFWIWIVFFFLEQVGLC